MAPKGAIYRSPFGEWSLDESGRELTFKLNPAARRPRPTRSPATCSRSRRPAAATFRSDLASLVESVSIAADNSVVLHLKRVHVRPESLFQFPPPATNRDATGGARPTGPFSIADYAPDLVVFARATPLPRSEGPGEGGPRAIVEQTMPSDEAAVAALLGGEVDVLDRVPPWQLERLRTVPEVRIGSYKLPTVHVLIPNLDRPLLAKREFRRALCYGIDRKWIVDRVLLGGRAVPGFEAISGPFPAGTSLNDPIRYGYNNQVQPRPFEPRLASILVHGGVVERAKPAGEKQKQNEGRRSGKGKGEIGRPQSAGANARPPERPGRARGLPIDPGPTGPRRHSRQTP